MANSYGVRKVNLNKYVLRLDLKYKITAFLIINCIQSLTQIKVV